MTWYSTGTVKTTANSAVVIGTGTAWTNSGLRSGDMLLIGYSTISPRGYEIKSIDSATQITLVLPFPVAVNGANYVGIPMLSGDRTAITMALATQISKALADTEAMSAVYQAFYTSPGMVNLTLPGDLVVSGSSFQKLTSDMANKASLNNPTFTGTVTADIVALSTESTIKANGKNIIFSNGKTDIASISSTGVFSVNPIDSQGSFRSRRGAGGATGVNFWNFFYDGDVQVYVDSSNLGSITLRTASDKLLKKDIGYQETSGYLQEVMEWIPAKFKYIARGVIKESNEMLGFIANDLVKVSPDCVTGKGLQEGFDMLNPEGAYGLDQVAMIAKLTGAIHEQQAMIEALKKQVGDLTSSSEQTS